jgi:predicted secreted hydrolase
MTSRDVGSAGHRGVVGRRAGVVLVLVATIAGCTAGTGAGAGPILANPTAPRPSVAAVTPAPTRAPDPLPVVLPRDDAPHDRLTEWWYDTGHLRAADGTTYGFEFVIFRAERGRLPVSWASHLALTDEHGNRFVYAQRQEIGPQVDRSLGEGTEPQGFDLAVTGLDPASMGAIARPAWSMTGSDGRDHLQAVLDPAEATKAGSPGGLGLDLALAATKQPALHDRDGWIDFGPAGGSYYYSRTAMAAKGTLTLDGRTFAVDGIAWFDHQWGDFISIGGGGWDWFAVNLDNGTDLTLSLVRNADGTYPLIYGTLVAADGTVRHLDRDAFTVDVTAHWHSPVSGADYPAGWSIRIPDEDLAIQLRPTVADQELDTRATTGVIYWEGSQVVEATRGDRPLGGQAYVELTGYAASSAGGS